MVLITIAVVVAAVYVIKILNDVKYIAKKAKNETDLIAEDINDLRANVRQQGIKWKFLIDFFKKIKGKKK